MINSPQDNAISNSNPKSINDKSPLSNSRENPKLKQEQTQGLASDKTKTHPADIEDQKIIIDLKSREDVDLNTPLADLLWSNPISEQETKEELIRKQMDLSMKGIEMFLIHKNSGNQKSSGWRFSPEGIGFCFQKQVTQEFLKENNYDLIIRGHSFCPDGIQTHHDQKIISVFSTTNFGFHNNKRGGLVFIENMDDENDTEVRLERFTRLDKLHTFPEPHISSNINDVLF